MTATRVSGVGPWGEPTPAPRPIPGIPAPPPHYPGGGGAVPGAFESPASPWGRSAATNQLVGARFAPAIRLNPVTLRGPSSAGDSGWIQLTVDRPSFVWPCGYKSDGTTINLPFYEVLYAPLARPLIDAHSMRTARRGIAYLSNPGAWWLKYNAPVAGTPATLDCIVIDAQDPGVVSRYLSEPGCNYSTQAAVSLPGTTDGVLVAAANPYRKALTLQASTPAGPNVRIGVGGTAASWNGGTTGFRLVAGSFNSLTFAGDALTLDNVYAAAETAVAGTVTVIEYV